MESLVDEGEKLQLRGLAYTNVGIESINNLF